MEEFHDTQKSELKLFNKWDALMFFFGMHVRMCECVVNRNIGFRIELFQETTTTTMMNKNDYLQQGKREKFVTEWHMIFKVLHRL